MTEPFKSHCIRDRLILGQDDSVRAAKDLQRQGLHQQAAEQRARANAFELVLNWIDNGIPLR